MKIFKYKIFIPLLAVGFLFAAPVFAASQIYISQVQITGGKNNTNQDFVELFNPNSVAFNLKGYRLVKRSQNSQSDILVKSFSKDTMIPPESFYLWANSGFTNIGAKPDAVSSATLSDDNGTALRLGPADSGKIIDSLAWGNANNSFSKGTSINPGAGQSISRKNLTEGSSAYTIGPAKPHNSTFNDVAAAFEASESSQPKAATPANPAAEKTAAQATVVQQADTAGQVAGDEVMAPDDQAPAVSDNIQPTNDNQISGRIPNSKTSGSKYLWLAGLAAITLLFLIYFYFFRNRPKQ